MHLVDDREPFRAPELEPGTPVTVLTQTTLSVDDTQRSIQQIKQNFSDVLVRNDLCYATTNRQAAVKELCKLVDLVLVIGAPNSSNCNRLREVAEDHGVTAYLLNGPEEMDPRWFEGVQNVGITSGASTPEQLVEGGHRRPAPRGGRDHRRGRGRRQLRPAEGAPLAPSGLARDGPRVPSDLAPLSPRKTRGSLPSRNRALRSQRRVVSKPPRFHRFAVA